MLYSEIIRDEWTIRRINYVQKTFPVGRLYIPIAAVAN